MQKAQFKDKVWLLVQKDRGMSLDTARKDDFRTPRIQSNRGSGPTKAEDIPVLMLLRQNGEEAKGWRGLPFWWPVVMTPRSATTAIFANDEPVPATAPTSAGPVRSLSTEEIA